MTILLLILALLLAGGTVLLALGRPLRIGRPATRGSASAGEWAGAADRAEDARLVDDHVGLTKPVAPLPPVLLPDDPSARDVDSLRFGLGFRGYRIDQVDEVLDRLAVALEERDAVIADLRSRSAVGRGPER